jgi:hypothetical protein
MIPEQLFKVWICDEQPNFPARIATQTHTVCQVIFLLCQRYHSGSVASSLCRSHGNLLNLLVVIAHPHMCHAAKLATVLSIAARQRNTFASIGEKKVSKCNRCELKSLTSSRITTRFDPIAPFSTRACAACKFVRNPTTSSASSGPSGKKPRFQVDMEMSFARSAESELLPHNAIGSLSGRRCSASSRPITTPSADAIC